jgi:hypothetical protein
MEEGQTMQWSKRKRTKRRPMTCKTLQSAHRQLKIEQHEPEKCMCMLML